MSKIFFEPWIGSDYASGKRFGKRVMILGYRLWDRLPELAGAWDLPVDGAQQTKTWRYRLKQGKTCLAYGIRHPSSGFTGSEWRPHILEIIERA